MSPVLHIYSQVLRSNLKQIKAQTSSNFICPMVKSNAYGVGEGLVVGELLESGIQAVGVARIEEGLRLKRLFPQEEYEVLVFHPLQVQDLEVMAKNGLTPVVTGNRDLETLSSCSEGVRQNLNLIHVKFDLGMNRFGFHLEEAQSVALKIKDLGLKVAGVAGHLPTAEDWQDPKGFSAVQFKRFQELAFIFDLPPSRLHLPNTQALALHHFECGLRPGLGLYLPPEHQVHTQLKSALKLTAPLIFIRSVKKGESVSYGGSWEAPADDLIGVLPIGYADGLRRGLSNRISVGLNGKAFPLVGAICMDYCMVSLGADSQVQIGDEFVLFDESKTFSLTKWAQALDALPYEILTGLGERIVRKLVL